MQADARRPGTCALAAAAFALMLCAPSALKAQAARADREARRNDMQMRQWALRDLERLKNDRPEGKRAARPAYADVAHDFEQLQLVNYSLANAAGDGKSLDFELIRKGASAVRERATRLKGYLSLPEVGAQKAQGAAAETETQEGLRSSVASLDALVKSFAWNPVFRQPNVVDLEQSSKASRDLAGIIALSEQIRKGAAELCKGARKGAKK